MAIRKAFQRPFCQSLFIHSSTQRNLAEGQLCQLFDKLNTFYGKAAHLPKLSTFVIGAREILIFTKQYLVINPGCHHMQ